MIEEAKRLRDRAKTQRKRGDALRKAGREELASRAFEEGRKLLQEAAGSLRTLDREQVAKDLAAQISAGSGGISGLMLESFLVDGRQDHQTGRDLVHGQSITDACMGWERTLPVFHLLADAVRARRGG